MKNIISGFTILFSVNFSFSKNFYLDLQRDFLGLVECQKELFLSKISQRNIKLIRENFTIPREYENFVLAEISDSNPDDEDGLAQEAYYMIQAQKERFVFGAEYCEKIRNGLKRYLEKTFLKYKNIIRWHDYISSSCYTDEQYNASKEFLKFFEGYENEPLEKLGSIFKEAEQAESISNVCVLQ